MALLSHNEKPGKTNPTSLLVWQYLVFLHQTALKKLFQQLVWGRSPGKFMPTVERETYYPSLVVGGKLTRVKIVDSPLLPYFPVYSAYNIRDLQLASVNSAQASCLPVSNDHSKRLQADPILSVYRFVQFLSANY